ncbi:FUSC family protein [Streptomyces varsoviensis]|uniref:FUSC family protein n=1 Tax=Streptomyces varsoviensis TaxID=67373 RepID=UPI0004C97936|nr:aromatic acid exporter family protein [Streptomyces varsoviensis]
MSNRLGSALAAEVRGVARATGRAAKSAGPERDTAVQALKAAAAALAAWALAGWWWHAPMALLAPWTAVVLVQSTVYRSLWSAAQQFVVVATGTLIAAAAATLTHDVMAAMAIALPITVLLGTYSRFGEQGWYAPTAALFVLTYGSYGPVEILHRLLETLLGAVVGVLVNALVLPPVHTGGVRQLRARVPTDCADLLRDAADGIESGYDSAAAEDWYARAQRLGTTVAELESARRRAEESRRLNPGRRLRRSAPHPPPGGGEFRWERVAGHLASLTRSLAETVRERPRFAAPPETALGALAVLLRAAGDVCAVDADRFGPAEADEERAVRAWDEAQEASRRLASHHTDPDGGPVTASLGELTVAATRLLDDLEAVAAPPDATGRT